MRRLKREDTGEATRAAAAGVRPSAGWISGDNLNTMIPVLEARKTGGGELRTFSAYPTGTYYIYAFDGRLLAEYNDMGFCVRDYIYLGGKMVAEHRPLENRYYYYGTDQIGSTRIVTGDNGEVVYAAAHDPYGGVQHTWTNTYDPSLKFSGKGRDVESGLDYFGARYYDRSIYRFLTVDPIIPAGAATANPQRWNLYAYCLNNPVNYVDLSGAYAEPFLVVVRVGTTSLEGKTYVTGELWIYGPSIPGSGRQAELIAKTWEPYPSIIEEGEYIGKITISPKDNKWMIILCDKKSGKAIWKDDKVMAIHSGDPKGSKGCIIVKNYEDLRKAIEYCLWMLRAIERRMSRFTGLSYCMLSFYFLDYYSFLCEYYQYGNEDFYALGTRIPVRVSSQD